MKIIKTKDGKELIFYTIEEVFKKYSKSKVFRDAYKKEMNRLKNKINITTKTAKKILSKNSGRTR